MLTFDESTHVYRWNGAIVPGVTSILRSALGNPFEGVPFDVLDRKRRLGVAVHRTTELDDLGRLDPASVHPEVEPYLRAWRRFRADTGFRPTAVERQLYHRTLGYAGTLDREGDAGPECWLPDIKSGEPTAQAELQTAGYALIRTSEGARIDRRGSVWLRSDGTYRWLEYNRATDTADFLAALRVHRWKERTTRRIA